MKNRTSYVKLGLLMLLGAFIGMSISRIIRYSGEEMKALGAEVSGMLYQKGLLIESILVFIAIAAAIGIYSYLRRLWKMEEESEDEKADLYGEKFEHWVQIGIMITNVSEGFIFVFGCMVFPAGLIDISLEDAVYYLMLTSVLIVGVLAIAILQIMFYHLMQKRDPQKKGDPSSFSFSKKWLDSCDETEKLVIYQAGYKAYSGMQILLMVGMIFALFGKIEFGTGDFPLVLLGTMWIAGNLNYGIWKMRGLKKKNAGK